MGRNSKRYPDSDIVDVLERKKVKETEERTPTIKLQPAIAIMGYEKKRRAFFYDWHKRFGEEKEAPCQIDLTPEENSK